MPCLRANERASLDFQKRFVDRRLPLSIAKAYIYILLVGLDYLHSECNVVHTGEYPLWLFCDIET